MNGTEYTTTAGDYRTKYQLHVTDDDEYVTWMVEKYMEYPDLYQQIGDGNADDVDGARAAAKECVQSYKEGE